MRSLFLPRLAGVQGFEPQLPDPESGVLPLDDTPMTGNIVPLAAVVVNRIGTCYNSRALDHQAGSEIN